MTMDRDELETLHYHAMVGNYLRVQSLLNYGVDPDEKHPNNNRTPLMSAARNSHREIVKLLINSGADINCCDKYGLTALHHASVFGSVEVVQCLVNCKGVAFDKKDCSGSTPMMVAAKFAHKEIVELLINSGADADTNCRDDTVLHKASFFGWVEIVHCIVNKGVALNIKNYDGQTPLMCASQRGRVEIVKFLVNRGADPDEKDSRGGTALMYASEESNSVVVEVLLDLRADIHCCDADGLTALHHASLHGSIEVFQCLMNYKGIAFDAKDSYGFTPLMCAVLFSRIEVYQLLLNSGADIHCCDNNGRTVLHHASSGGSVEIVQSLVNRGAVVNKKSREGDTPFMLAVGRSSRELVELLVNSDADVHCCDDFGWTVLHHALRKSDVRDQADKVRLLLQKGVDINAQDFTGTTPLHLAVRFDKTEIAAYLLKAGADCNLEDSKGESPFSILIRKNRHVEIIKLCIERGAYGKIDCNKLSEDSLLKTVILQDIKLCSQAIINKFDNVDLPLLYKGLTSDQKLPRTDVMKIGNRSGISVEVERAVTREIKVKGFCNLFEMVPLVLSILCVRSFIKKL